MYFEHNSWNKLYKDPFGAAPIGSEVTFRVRSNETVNNRLHTRFRGHEQFYDMLPSPEDPHLFEVTITVPNTPGLLWYDFHFDAFNTHYVYGASPDGIGGLGQVNLFSQNSYQLTLYDPKRKVPDWYKEGVMYQIFPDRFNHGEREGFKPEYPSKTVLHTRWDDTPHYFRYPDGSIEYWDFFGGNLPGIIDKLDYLKDLGISILYLNPIFESSSNHKYDTANYLKIAPEFGNTEIFKELCVEAEKRGIKVILDGVFNHSGDDSIYFNRYGTYGNTGAYQDSNSPYVGWYNFTNYPNDYESWWGIKSMPSMNKNNPDYQDFIYYGDDSVVKTWLRNGASGWRLDVADELTDDFIVGIKDAMMSVDPDSVLIGEVWEDASNKIAYGKRRGYFSGKELDSVMNYPFRTAMLNFFQGFSSSAQSLREIMSLYEHYPYENFMSNMNLIGSHDRRRVLTALGDIPRTENLSEYDRENFRLNEEQLKLAKERLKLLTLIQMTFPGVPVVYYGDEVGTEGLEDPYNRGTMRWDDIDTEIYDWYKFLIDLRNHSDILKKGDFIPIDTSEDVLAYVREYEGEKYIVAVNRNPEKAYVIPYASPDTEGIDILTDMVVDLKNIGLPPLGKVLIKVNKN